MRCLEYDFNPCTYHELPCHDDKTCEEFDTQITTQQRQYEADNEASRAIIGKNFKPCSNCSCYIEKKRH